jgi:hypothetical protein
MCMGSQTLHASAHAQRARLHTHAHTPRHTHALNCCILVHCRHAATAQARMPTKAEKEPMRSLYDRYNALKTAIKVFAAPKPQPQLFVATGLL